MSVVTLLVCSECLSPPAQKAKDGIFVAVVVRAVIEAGIASVRAVSTNPWKEVP